MFDPISALAARRASDSQIKAESEMRAFAYDAAGLLDPSARPEYRMQVAILISQFLAPHWGGSMQGAACSAVSAACVRSHTDLLPRIRQLFNFFSTGLVASIETETA